MSLSQKGIVILAHSHRHGDAVAAVRGGRGLPRKGTSYKKPRGSSKEGGGGKKKILTKMKRFVTHTK
jgi:hypothetical protein